MNENITNSFEQVLIDNNYKIYNDYLNNALRLFSKPIKDGNGKKYYIHCYHYNFGLTFPGKANFRDSYTFKVQFTIEKNNIINIEYSGEFVPEQNKYNNEITLLEEVEIFFEQQFINIKAKYNDNTK
jgi:hypothetical protein